MTSSFSRNFLYIASGVFVRLGINKGHIRHLSGISIFSTIIGKFLAESFIEKIEILWKE